MDYSKSGGLSYAVYVRKTDGSPAVLLGEGGAVSLSPDGKWAYRADARRRPLSSGF